VDEAWPVKVRYTDGRLSIQYDGRDLPYRMFDKLQKVDEAIGAAFQ